MIHPHRELQPRRLCREVRSGAQAIVAREASRLLSQAARRMRGVCARAKRVLGPILRA